MEHFAELRYASPRMSNKPGRPRDTSLDTAIAEAVETVLLSSGYAAVTMERVAATAGTTRTALYRRFTGRIDLVTSAVVTRFGTDPTVDTGSLRGDLIDLQRTQQAFFQDPVVQASMAGLLGDIRADPRLTELFHGRFMGPRRTSTAAMLQRAVDRGEIPPVADPALISDMLTGPLLLRSALPAVGPIDDALLAATVDSAMHLLSSPVVPRLGETAREP
jgi:AcrR family transcriptional regulator